jgi:hypothetical protein
LIENVLRDISSKLNLNFNIEIRKIDENSYLLVCDSNTIAQKLLDIEIEEFKLRLLKSSPDKVK